MLGKAGFYWRLLAAACLALAGPAAALEGNPPLTALKPDIAAPPQNGDIAQDASSIVFVANGGGILDFDGERWQLTRLPTGDVANSLAYDGGARVYVGGYGVLGYLERDDTGAEVFHDLTPLFRHQLQGESFAQVWYVRCTPHGVFFVGTRYTFRYEPRTQAAQLWRHPGRFGPIVQHGHETVLQFRGEGLRRFTAGSWRPLAGSAPMAELLNALLPLPDGGLLGASSNGHWLEWHEGATRERIMPPGFPPASQFDAGCVLQDGRLVFANVDGTLWLLDPASNRASSIHVTRGSLNAVAPANDGGLLAVSDLGIFHLDRPGGWSVIGPAQGIVGEIHNIRRWGRQWLALSDSGAYTAPDAAPAAFRRLPWTDNDAFDFLPVDESHALLAEFYRLETIDEGGAHVFGDHDLYPRLLLRSRFDPGLVYVGTEFGLAVLRRQGQGWRLLMDHGPAEMRVNSIVELERGDLLIGTQRDGVHRLRLNADGTQLAADQPLGAADGIRYDRVARVMLSDDAGGALASTRTGLFRWRGERFVPEQLDGLYAQTPLPAPLAFASAPGGDRWAFGGDRIYRGRPGQPWHAKDVATLVSGFIESIAFDGTDGTLFGCANSILRYPSGEVAPPPATSLMLRAVEQKTPGGQRQRLLQLQPAIPPQLPNDATVTVAYALPDFQGQHAARYQWRLLGSSESFSEWEAVTSHTFSHMHPGRFVMQLRGRDSFGRISELPPYTFVFLPQWYATAWARALWLTLGLATLGALTYAGISWRTRQLRATQARLEGVIAERTRELRTANQRLYESAHHDLLTGRPNRALFEIRLEQARATAERHHGRFAVLFIDLDQFKTINDGLGHEAGDRLLREMAERLSAALRCEDTLARWGGDEFAALVENLHSGDDAAVVAQALLEAAARGFELAEGHPAVVSTSIGISLYPDDTTTVAELIRNADTAMYSAKNRGGNQYRFYSSTMTEQARTRLAVRNGLRVAVERNELLLHYQPLADVASGRIVGAEALLRWRQDGGELAEPGGFIPIAEASGLIPGIGRWVLETACREGRAWIGQDPQFKLAINVSPRQLRDLDLVTAVGQVLRDTGMPASGLILEVTESSIAEAGEEATRTIGQLKALGVQVAVDDFGTGLSSLASLKRFAFDALKIDRSFVRDIPQDRADMEIAATIVAMGHSLGLSVTAEGVETAEQLEFLRRCGCDRYQGFLLSPGVSAEAFSGLLRRHQD